MTIKAGDNMPEGRFTIMKADGPGSVSSKEFFEGKKVVLFSVPGAFTPTCSRPWHQLVNRVGFGVLYHAAHHRNAQLFNPMPR